MTERLEPHDPPLETLELPHPGRGPVRFSREGPRGGSQVLCVHGVPGNTRDWRYLGPALAARGFEVFRVDLPGFGESPRSSWRDDTVQGRASLIALIARTLRLERPVLAGHSIGSPPALLAAAWYPERIAGLLLINSPGLERHRGLRRTGAPGALRRALQIPVLNEQVLAIARQGFRAAGFRDREVEALDLPSLAQLFAVAEGLDFRALRAAAREVRCPVLLASAADDPLIEPRIAHGLADALEARCVHVHYETGGHYLQKHQARDLAQRASALWGAL